MDIIKELVKRIGWTCPADFTTMLFLNYTIDTNGMNLTITVSCPKCGKRIWIRWSYEMDGETK